MVRVTADMNRLLTLRKLIALATALLGSSLLGCNDSASNAGARYGGQAAAVPVMTVPATLTDLRETLTSVGTARALKSVSVYAEASGRVTAVAIDADIAVAEGDLLLQLDDRDETLAVELATVKLADAERLVTRYTTVNARDANIPESQLDDARAAVDSARIALEQARVDLDRRRIIAPFSGRGMSVIKDGIKASSTDSERLAKPEWLRMRVQSSPKFDAVRSAGCRVTGRQFGRRY